MVKILTEKAQKLRKYLRQYLGNKESHEAKRSNRKLSMPIETKESSLIVPEGVAEKLEVLELPAVVLERVPEINITCNSTVEEGAPVVLPSRVPVAVLEPKPLISFRIVGTLRERFEVLDLSSLAVPVSPTLRRPELRFQVVDDLPEEIKVEKPLMEVVPKQYVELSDLSLRREESLLREVGDFLRRITCNLGGATGIDRPVLIIAQKPSRQRPRAAGEVGGSTDYIRHVALVCRELYRILGKRGKPQPLWIRFSGEESDECMLLEISSLTSTENHVIVLENVRPGHLERFRLLDRLRELYSQGLGFIILYTDRVEGVYEVLIREVGDHSLPEVIRVEGFYLPPDAWYQLAELFWGYVDERVSSFDEAVGLAEKKFYEKLREAYRRTRLKLWVNFDENEGFEHRALKMKIIEIVARSLGARTLEEVIELIKEGVIKTEFSLGEEKDREKRRADIYVHTAGGDVYIEIETLYGVGDPVQKIRQTLDKYLGEEGGKFGGSRVGDAKIAVVLIGIHAILYLRELLSIKETYARDHGLNVEFYTIDMREDRLVPLGEILERLREIASHIKPLV